MYHHNKVLIFVSVVIFFLAFTISKSVPALAKPTRMLRNDFAQDFVYDHNDEDFFDSTIYQKHFEEVIDLEKRYRTLVIQEQMNSLRDHHRILEFELFYFAAF